MLWHVPAKVTRPFLKFPPDLKDSDRLMKEAKRETYVSFEEIKIVMPSLPLVLEFKLAPSSKIYP